MNANILITGATGFIGYEVARQLSEAKRKPRLMIRRPLRGLIVKSLDAEFTQADLENPRSLELALDGIDTVIHMGAVAIFDAYSKVSPSIVTGSMNLMGAAVDAGVRRFVYAGTLLVYDHEPGVIGQDTAPRPRSEYGRAKLEAEQQLAKMAAEGGVTFTSIRLPHTYGAMSLLFEQIRKGRVIFPGRGDNLYAHLHVADAARALIRAAEIGPDGIYVIADNQACTWNELFQITSTLYPRLRVIRIPQWLALLGTGLAETARRFSRQPSKFTRDAVRSWNLRLPVKGGTLSGIFDIEPHYPTIESGIPAVLCDSIGYCWRPSVTDRIR